jgi:hypothetical protein
MTSLEGYQRVTLSHSTVSRIIEDVSCIINSKLTKRLESSQGFTMQVSECTDVACLSVVLAFVRYIYNSEAEEEMPVCKQGWVLNNAAVVLEQLQCWNCSKK